MLKMPKFHSQTVATDIITIVRIHRNIVLCNVDIICRLQVCY